MKTRTLIFTCAALFAASAQSAPATTPQAAAQWNQPDAEMEAVLARKGDPAKGKVAYKVCLGCHKADASGKSDALYPQLAGQHPSVLIKQVMDVRAGRRESPKMHPFIEKEAISNEDLADIAAYLHALPVPATNGKGNGRQLDLGKHLYERDCATCHGKRGEGDGTKFYPRVAGQHYKYLSRETFESRDRGRRNANPDMVKVLKHYVDSDIEAVSDYMSRLKTVGKDAGRK